MVPASCETVGAAGEPATDPHEQETGASNCCLTQPILTPEGGEEGFAPDPTRSPHEERRRRGAGVSVSGILEVGNVGEDHGRAQLQLLLEGFHIGWVHPMHLQPVSQQGGRERG